MSAPQTAVPSEPHLRICPLEPPEGICLFPLLVGCVYLLAPVAMPFSFVLSPLDIRPSAYVVATELGMVMVRLLMAEMCPVPSETG